MVFILGIIVIVVLMSIIISLSVAALAIFSIGFASWAVLMVGGFVGAAMFGNSDAQLAFYICGLLSTVMLWLGISYFNNLKKNKRKSLQYIFGTLKF